MSLQADWPCWEIMKCNPDNAAQCPAYKAEKPCWEVMEQFDPYSFNICRDCIVYLIKQKSSMFSRDEIRSIIHRKGLDAGGLRCPQHRAQEKATYVD